jgi:hypothetical protein
MEREGKRVTGTVEGRDFRLSEIIRLYRPTKFHRFHDQRWKLRHSGADV